MQHGGTSAAEQTSAHLQSSGRLLVGRLLAVLLSGLTQVLAVRSLSMSSYGVLALGLVVAEVVHRVVSVVHGQAAPRFLAVYEDRRDAPRLVGTLTLAAGAITGLTSVVLVAGLLLHGPLSGLLVHGDEHAMTVLLLLALYGGGEAFDDLVGAALAALGRADAIFWRRYVIGPGLRLLLTAAVLQSGGGVLGLAVAYTGLELAGVVLYAWVLTRMLAARGLLPTRPQLPVRLVLAFGLPLVSVELYNVALHGAGALFMAALHGPVDVAQLRAVAPLAALNLLVLYTFTTMYTPLATRLVERQDHEGLRAAYWSCTRWLLVLSFPVYALTGPLSGPVTTGVLGERYAPSGPVLALLATAFFANAAMGLNAATAVALGRTRALMGANLASTVTVLVLDVALIPPYGARGAAAAVLVAVVTQNLLVQRLLRVAGIPLLSRPHLALMLHVGALAAALHLLSRAVPLSLVPALVAAAVAGLGLLALHRRDLRAGDLFPELRRVPGVRRLA